MTGRLHRPYGGRLSLNSKATRVPAPIGQEAQPETLRHTTGKPAVSVG
jgi:hypothetical protein